MSSLLCWVGPHFPFKTYFSLILFILLIPKEGRKTKKMLTWETSINCLLNVPWLGIKPATQVSALTRNQTCNLLVCKTTPNQLSHTNQGSRPISQNITSPKEASQRWEQGTFLLFARLFKFFKDFIYLFFRERKTEGEREGEIHQWVVASHAPPTGDLAHNTGMCPDWESNQRPFGQHWCEPHQPGHVP